MIAFLRGRLLSKSPNRAIVECAGVGYDATISVATFTSLPPEGAEARLHIYTHVREDQIALFGFAEPDEKRLFERLLTISGIGPKLAITVLSGIDAARLVTAIRGERPRHADAHSGDREEDRRARGAGAQGQAGRHGRRAVGSRLQRYGPAGDDALSALVNLGYARPIAQRAIETAIAKQPDAAQDFEVLFRAAMAAIR